MLASGAPCGEATNLVDNHGGVAESVNDYI